MTLKDHLRETIEDWQSSPSPPENEPLIENLAWVVTHFYLGEWKVYRPGDAIPGHQYILVRVKTNPDFHASSIRVAVYSPSRNEIREVFSLRPEPTLIKIEDVTHYRVFPEGFFDDTAE